MNKLRVVGQDLVAKGKSFAGVLVVTAGAVAGPAFADGAGIDVSAVVSTIGEGLVALAAIGAAWVGFKYLQKVWNRV